MCFCVSLCVCTHVYVILFVSIHLSISWFCLPYSISLSICFFPSQLELSNTPTTSLQSGKTHTHNKCHDMTVNHLMVRLQYRSFGECGVCLHCHYSYVNSYPECSYLLRSHVDQIGLFNHFLYRKPFNYVHTKNSNTCNHWALCK